MEMSLLCSLLCTAKQGDLNGSPLIHWEVLDANKRVEVTNGTSETWVPVRNDFWETTLTKSEYRVLRKKGTEGAGRIFEI